MTILAEMDKTGAIWGYVCLSFWVCFGEATYPDGFKWAKIKKTLTSLQVKRGQIGLG